MKLKYLIILCCILSLNTIALSEPIIIYDNITSSQYKTITINDDINYKILTDYKYDVYVDGLFIGKYAKDEQIFIPDNSSILIYIPAPISTDFGTAWDLGKTYFAIAIMGLFALGLVIFFLIYFYKKTTRRY